MKTRVLGRTGLVVPEVVLGGGRVGGFLIYPDEATRARALERALEACIDWVDTAAMYGDGESESTLGRLGRRFRISTKVQLKPGDEGDIAGAVERSLEASLKRLDRSRVEVLQLHNALGHGERRVPVDWVLRKGGIADALERLKSRGLIAAMGMTASGDTTACLQVIRGGRFDTAQVYYNALNPSAAWSASRRPWSAQDFAGIIDACTRENMGIFNIRAFAGGSLASPERHGREFVMADGSDLDREARRAERLRHALGGAYGSDAEAALRFCLGEPRLSTCVVGLASLDQLETAIEAERLGPLPAAALDKLRPLWEADFA